MALLFLVILVALQVVSQNVDLFPGRTTASPGWKRVGKHDYYATPLLGTANLMPLLEGSYGSFTPSLTRQFEVYGSLDGIGIEQVGDYWYIYVNHEYSIWHQTTLPGETNPFFGAHISLYVFTKDFQIIGGRELVQNKKSAVTGATLNDPFGGLCSGVFIPAGAGFVDGGYFVTSEEGDGGYASWVVNVKTGLATRIEGLGALHHENTVPASAYLPTKGNPAKNTVFLTTDDSPNGEVFMFVGSQTDSDPNGFSKGQLYVLLVPGYPHETIPETQEIKATWTPVPSDIATKTGRDGYEALEAWVTVAGRSTTFRKVEDINEDPKNPGTFYFTATGGNFPVNASLNLTNSECGQGMDIEGGCDNPFGKIYQLILNNTDPSSSPTIQLMLVGSNATGAGYDNLCITRGGQILVLEDPTPTALSEIYQPNNRYVQVWNYDWSQGSILPMFEVDYASLQPDDAPYAKHMSHSGIVEFGPESNPLYMIALQSAAYDNPGDDKSQLKIYSGQLAIFSKHDHQAVLPNNTVKSFGVIQPRIVYEKAEDSTGLVVACIFGWVFAALSFSALVFLYLSKKRAGETAPLHVSS